jgi:TolB-like protein/DNA-binding winged helix-turn-helix (wHTH) protein
MPTSAGKEPRSVSTHRVVFDRFELDLRAGELHKNGRRIRLQAQPFQLLALLIENAGQVVTRDEVCRVLWPGDTFVDFDHGVAAALNKVREALGDSADSPRFIETLPKRGYRFIGEIQRVSESLAAVETASAPAIGPARPETGSEPEGANLRQRSGVTLFAAIAVMACILLASVIYMRRSSGNPAASSAGITSIAVLPLENLSGDHSQEYIADGMTDELITELARTKGLRVISRTSVMQYKGVHRPLPEIARELGVDGILEGSVLDQGGKIRVTVQLIQAATDTHVWAQSYIRDAGDMLNLQQELAADVAKEVSTSAPAQKPARAISPEAHDAYLQGRYAWYGVDGDAEHSREMFEKAIQLQPDYAAAYSGLADYYGSGSASEFLDPVVALPKGAETARKALALDDSSAEAHNSMGASYMFYRRDFRAAEAEVKKAIELNPNYAEAYHLYAYILTATDREDEALAEQRKSQELDPFARPWGIGKVLIAFGHYQEAEADLRQRMAALPGSDGMHELLADALLGQGRMKEWSEEFAKAERQREHREFAAQVPKVFAASGYRGVLELRLAFLKKSAQKGYVSPMAFARVYAQLGDKDEAFQWLDKACAENAPWLIWLRRHPMFDSLHGDPRFDAMAKRLGLP